MKTGQVVLEEKTFKEFKVLYLYKGGELGWGGGGGGGKRNFDPNKHFTTLIIHCKV